MMKNKLFALIGKAGSGKDTIATNLLNEKPEWFHKIVSYTTRPKRDYEKEGIDYYYITKEEFLKKKNNGEMLETAEFNGWLYGTSLDSLAKDKINVGVFNPEGTRQLLKNTNIEVTTFLVWAETNVRLERQIRRETDPNLREIMRRCATDKYDFENLGFKPIVELQNNTLGELLKNVDTVLNWAANINLDK